MSRRSASVVMGGAVLGLAAVGILAYGCWRASYAVGFLPPVIPGATYVGTTSCIVCHPEQGKTFRGAAHAVFNLPEREGQEANAEGCESCHGPGSLHVQDYHNKTKIVRGDWKVCVQCHLDKRAEFSLLYHHPVPEGLISCTDCHDPHDGRRPVFRAEEINDKCFECHPEVRGPFVFPHLAVTEDGCTVCHAPHGSSLSKMLVADQNNLCLRCHFQANFPRIGDSNHSSRFARDACTTCHQGIHGSNFNEALRHP